MPFMQYNILIHKYLTGVINSEETLELNKWLSDDPLHRREFEEIKLLWDSAEEDEAEVTDVQFHEGLRKMERAIEDSTEKEHLVQRHIIRNRYKNLVIAILAITTVFLFAWMDAHKMPESSIMASNNGNQELVLTDNSRMVLNDNSTASFSTGSDRREVSIKGEAFFEVSKDSRPFIVTANDVTLTVLGTSFNVRAYPDKPVEVIVISGSVEVKYQDSVIILFSGEKSRLAEYEGLTKLYNDDPNFNAWYTGKLEFNKTELKEILPLLEKQYHTSFNVTDPQILGCRFTGKFDNSALEDVIKTLSFSLDISFTSRIANSYTVSGKGCT